MRKLVLATAAVLAACFFAGSALAVPPTLSTVGATGMRPSVTFSAPKAANVTVYVATKPDRDAHGAFVIANVLTVAVILDPTAIQSGTWSGDTPLAPGQYYVMVKAIPDFDACFNSGSGSIDDSCANGFSDVAPLTIRPPAIHYTATATPKRSAHKVALRLTANPLGTTIAYKVCFKPKAAKVRRCIPGTLRGTSWSAPTSGALSASTRGLGAKTTFTWIVAGRTIAAKTVRTK